MDRPWIVWTALRGYGGSCTLMYKLYFDVHLLLQTRMASCDRRTKDDASNPSCHKLPGWDLANLQTSLPLTLLVPNRDVGMPSEKVYAIQVVWHPLACRSFYCTTRLRDDCLVLEVLKIGLNKRDNTHPLIRTWSAIKFKNQVQPNKF